MPTSLPRRRFLRQLALGVAGAPFVGCASRTNGLEVGVIADPQYADLPDRGTRAYRASIAKLGAAVEHFNARPLDFCVNLGDTIDREWRSYDAILAPPLGARPRQSRFRLAGRGENAGRRPSRGRRAPPLFRPARLPLRRPRHRRREHVRDARRQRGAT
jgi:hypothetical protein